MKIDRAEIGFDEAEMSKLIHDRIPLRLSESLESNRGELEQELSTAHRRIVAFARHHGWEHHTVERFAQEAWIHDSKASFDESLRRILQLDQSTDLPPTAAAALEKGILVAVSPAVYSAIYPEGIEPHSFEKLLAHEIAHRLHIRILDGDEEAMGPVWFFEGFAIIAAGQFERTAPVLCSERIVALIRSVHRQSYRDYAAVMRILLAKVSLQELVRRAEEADFIEWTLELMAR
jgi:hypothetical protein